MPKDLLPNLSGAEKAPGQPTPNAETEEGEEKPFPLLDLPPDILAEVLKKLPPGSVVRLSGASHELRAFVIGRDDIWATLGGKKQTIQIQVDDVTQQAIPITAYQDFNQRILALPKAWQKLVSEGHYTLVDAEKIRSILGNMISSYNALIFHDRDEDNLSPDEVKKFQEGYAELMTIPAYKALNEKFPSLLEFTRQEPRRAEEDDVIRYYINRDAVQYAQKFLEGAITFQEAAAVPVEPPPSKPTAYLKTLLTDEYCYQILHEMHTDGTPLVTFEQMAKIPPNHFFALINMGMTLTSRKMYKGLELSLKV